MKSSLFQGAILAALVGPACYSGEATLGAVCRSDGDCGDGQTCERRFCGACGDGVSQGGELCLEQASAELPTASLFAVGDFNADGRGDLLTFASEAVPPNATVLLGSGSGFEVGASVEVGPVSVAIPGDADADENTDVVVLGSTGAAILFGDGSGAFSVVDAPPLAGAVDVRVAADATVWAARGSAIETFAVRARALEPVGQTALPAAASELIGPLLLSDDENEDLICVLDSGAVSVLTGADSGFETLPSEGFSAPVTDVWLTDIDGDGRPELLGLTASGVEGLAGQSDGSFVAALQLESVPGATNLVVYDITGDLIRDLIVFGGIEGVYVHPGVLRSFDPPVRFIESASATEVTQFRVGTDPFPDLIVAGVGQPLTVLEAAP